MSWYLPWSGGAVLFLCARFFESFSLPFTISNPGFCGYVMESYLPSPWSGGNPALCSLLVCGRIPDMPFLLWKAHPGAPGSGHREEAAHVFCQPQVFFAVQYVTSLYLFVHSGSFCPGGRSYRVSCTSPGFVQVFESGFCRVETVFICFTHSDFDIMFYIIKRYLSGGCKKVGRTPEVPLP